MNTILEEALRNVPLEPGRVYTCQVGGLRVEVRVADACAFRPDPISPQDIRLDPWTDLPTPGPAFVAQAVPGGPLLPDPPILPDEGEGA